MKFRVLALMASALSLAACDGSNHATSDVKKHLTVWGPHDGVSRFAKLQGSLRPALPVSGYKSLGGGKSQVTVTLPASYASKDLVHITREALAADLAYSFELRLVQRTSRT